MLVLVSKNKCWLEKQQIDYHKKITRLYLILETLAPNKTSESFETKRNPKFKELQGYEKKSWKKISLRNILAKSKTESEHEQNKMFVTTETSLPLLKQWSPVFIEMTQSL